MAERAAEVAAQAGAITDEERERWLEALAATRAAGDASWAACTVLLGAPSLRGR